MTTEEVESLVRVFGEAAAQIKEVVSIPVIVAGRMNDPSAKGRNTEQ